MFRAGTLHEALQTLFAWSAVHSADGPCCTEVDSYWATKACQMRKMALKLQAYLFEVRHCRSTENANADAMSRPPIAVPFPAPAAVISMTQTSPDCFQDEDFHTITYLEGREGSRPSVPEELECEV